MQLAHYDNIDYSTTNTLIGIPCNHPLLLSAKKYFINNNICTILLLTKQMNNRDKLIPLYCDNTYSDGYAIEYEAIRETFQNRVGVKLLDRQLFAQTLNYVYHAYCHYDGDGGIAPISSFDATCISLICNFTPDVFCVAIDGRSKTGLPNTVSSITYSTFHHFENIPIWK